MSSKANLDNLVRSGGLKTEPPDRKECEGLLRSAMDRLQDARNPNRINLGRESRIKLKFRVQPYQTHAVDSLADNFAGQPKSSGVSYRIDPGAVSPAPTFQARKSLQKQLD